MKNLKHIGNSKFAKRPKLEVFGRLTEKYIPAHELNPNEKFSENDVMHFQAGLLFCITHDN